MEKNLPVMQKTWVQLLGWEDPTEKGMTTHSVFLPRESHGQRSLVGYSPWGHKKSDTTERLTIRFLKCAHFPSIGPMGSQRVGHDRVTNTKVSKVCSFSFTVYS